MPQLCSPYMFPSAAFFDWISSRYEQYSLNFPHCAMSPRKYATNSSLWYGMPTMPPWDQNNRKNKDNSYWRILDVLHESLSLGCAFNRTISALKSCNERSCSPSYFGWIFILSPKSGTNMSEPCPAHWETSGWGMWQFRRGKEAQETSWCSNPLSLHSGEMDESYLGIQLFASRSRTEHDGLICIFVL